MGLVLGNTLGVALGAAEGLILGPALGAVVGFALGLNVVDTVGASAGNVHATSPSPSQIVPDAAMSLVQQFACPPGLPLHPGPPQVPQLPAQQMFQLPSRPGPSTPLSQ